MHRLPCNLHCDIELTRFY